jgi:sodium/bile acid cotransporter 7
MRRMRRALLAVVALVTALSVHASLPQQPQSPLQPVAPRRRVERPPPVPKQQHRTQMAVIQGSSVPAPANVYLRRPVAPLAVSQLVRRVFAFLSNYWFLIGEILAVTSAYAFPNLGCTGGKLRTDKYMNVAMLVICFINGFSLPTEEVKAVASGWQINTLTLLYTSLCIPFVVNAVITPLVAHPGYRDGIICLSALPCTVHLCVSSCRAAGANVSTATFITLVSNFFGSLATPMIVAWMMRDAIGAPVDTVETGFALWPTFHKLLRVVVLPMVAGQLARVPAFLRQWQRRNRVACRVLGDVLLLAMAQHTFSDGFMHHRGVDHNALLNLAVVLPIGYLLSTCFFWWVSKLFAPRVDVRTRCAAVIASSQKSLAIGIPFVKAIFVNRRDQADIMVPMLVFAQVRPIWAPIWAPM